jgi:hypothetical protein
LTAIRRQRGRAAADVCPTCGWAGALVWVHGHGQCPRCGMVLAPCCEGAPLGEAEPDLDAPDEIETETGPKN